MVASLNSARILRVCIALVVENKWLILAGKVFKIHNLSDVDATLLEPASCAAHGLDKIAPKLGSSVLMFGAGPTGVSSLTARILYSLLTVMLACSCSDATSKRWMSCSSQYKHPHILKGSINNNASVGGGTAGKYF